MNAVRRDPRRLAMAASVLVSALALVGKMVAYFITHSAAILSDAAESVVHIAATGFAAFSLWYADQPADAGHPYGHRRIAYFSAGFEGALVFATSIAVIWNGILGLLRGPELRNLGVGLAIAGGLALVNLVLGVILVRVGRRHNALVLVSNGKHLLSDVLTTGGAIAGVGLVMLTGLEWLDPLAAVAIGVAIMVSGLSLARTSYGGLMDKVDTPLTEKLVAGLRENVADRRIAGFHQLRCRRTADEIWVDVHILVPGDVPMRDAHVRVTEVEDSIRRRFPQDCVHITSHMEPADHEAAHPGGHDDADGPLAQA